MTKPIIVSGIQPTGNLHVGNYLGAVKNWVDLQDSRKYQVYIFIADYHSLTGNMKPEDRHAQITRTAAELVAAGIDPEKTVLWVQSHVPEHTELAWVFNTVAPMGELKRMTQFKDKTGMSDLPVIQAGRTTDETYERFKEIMIERENKANVGLFTYPVLQAADILLYHGELVPVGQDQIQHVELTRDIAKWFNKRYGQYFPETKHLLTEIPKVMSLLEPHKKMSKSLGQGHVIELADEPEVIEKKLKKAVTATEGGEDSPGVANLLVLLKQFGEEVVCTQFIDDEKKGIIRYGDLKHALAEAIGNYFFNFRIRRAELLDNHNELADILARGAEQAQAVASKTMDDMRKIVGIR